MAGTFGYAFTVTTTVATLLHPLVLVLEYDIVLLPAATPVTTPVVFTVATAVLLLLHVPLLAVSLKVVFLPTQIDVVPEIALNVGPA